MSFFRDKRFSEGFPCGSAGNTDILNKLKQELEKEREMFFDKHNPDMGFSSHSPFNKVGPITFF